MQPSRRLKRETQRNIELMRLTGRRAPDFKTSFRKHNGDESDLAEARTDRISGKIAGLRRQMQA